MVDSCETRPLGAAWASENVSLWNEHFQLDQGAPRNQAKKSTDTARRRYLVAKLHALGPAPLYHFLTDLERGACLRETLESYAELDADFIKAFGGDQFSALFSIERATP